ncbi:hypothetical protein [uncultured Ruegeria sp.]|nr:hypothetical protein [uncultured Ruegeria sp.]
MFGADGAEATLPIADGGLRLVKAVTTPPTDTRTNAHTYADQLTA